MLAQLTIRDLVLVRELTLEFAPGMTTLTGETGAGKSILIDALGLALGGKTAASMIRAGSDRAEVAALFETDDCPEAARWLEAQALDEDGQCLLRRVIVRNGRSRAWINGRPVSLSQLRELGDRLLDIHGQHAHQSLIRPAVQRTLLDAFGGLREQVETVAARHARLRALETEHETLERAAADRDNRIDYLRFQIDELEAVVEDAGGVEALEAEQRRLAHAGRLREEGDAVARALSGDEDDLSGRLAAARRALEALAALDPALRGAVDLLDSAAIQIDEAAQELRHRVEDVELDPQRLEEVDRRLGRLHELARKHRVEPEALPGVLEGFREEFGRLDAADHRLADLRREIETARRHYDEAAERLSKARTEAAARLGEAVTERLRALAMPEGRFEVACARAEPAAHGIDRVAFLVAANPGQPAAPLGEAASGGELSRIALAIQVVTAGCSDIPTLVFDEVDVGIGGAVAEIVGRLLRELGARRQVLCVTHLPQVAAQAHHHLRVSKAVRDDDTETRVDPLSPDARVDEIARMLGGMEITERTRAHAQEMLQGASGDQAGR